MADVGCEKTRTYVIFRAKTGAKKSSKTAKNGVFSRKKRSKNDLTTRRNGENRALWQRGRKVPHPGRVGKRKHRQLGGRGPTPHLGHFPLPLHKNSRAKSFFLRFSDRNRPLRSTASRLKEPPPPGGPDPDQDPNPPCPVHCLQISRPRDGLPLKTSGGLFFPSGPLVFRTGDIAIGPRFYRASQHTAVLELFWRKTDKKNPTIPLGWTSQLRSL